MSLMDKFLDVMRLNGDDDDDDYDFTNEDYDDDDVYEEPKKKSSRKKEPKAVVEEEPKKQISKITPIGKNQKKQVASMEVCVIKPTSIEDEIEIVDTLISGRTVLINMEGLNIEIAQRIIDFTSGSTYAMHGSLQKVSNYIFLATPDGVDISGDIQNIMDAFDAGNGFTL